MAGSGQRRKPVRNELLIALLEGFRQRFQLVIHPFLASSQVNQVKEENRPDDNITEKKIPHNHSTLWTECLASASFHKYGNVCGERDGVEFAKRRRRDVCAHRGGGGTKKSMPLRRHPLG